ncbi:MAG TPA: DUF1552 domain-containing protein [Vicinamibacterales bacterium]|nr:DUF1552 domain-containing protein [Vicinamibacterales bacterium]
MFITRFAIPRRTFLRGVGATIALPMLDAMVPALSAAPAAPPRFSFLYIANGVIQDQWTPKSTGADWELTPILRPLAAHKSDINVISGLAHLQADTFGDGTGDHPRASAAWLTGVHAYDRTLPGIDVKLATSVDQILAQHIGTNTPVSSIELSVDYPTQGACDSGDCFYVNTVSWRNETTPNPTESHPRVVFERLFGDGGTSAERLAHLRKTSSILDSVRGEIGRLNASLGGGDRSKLGEYLDSVRDIEQRIQNAEKQSAQSFELPERPVDVPATFEDHAKLMLDLQVLGFRADVTRVSSIIMSRELSSMTFGQIGVPEQHHAVSHHRNDPELIAKKAKIDVYQAQLLAYFLDGLKAARDGDGTLLDHSLVLYGGGMGNGNLHRHTDLPCLLAGRLGGAFKTGRHLAYPTNTPMTNLLLTMLASAGIPQEKLGDSTGRLAPDILALG